MLLRAEHLRGIEDGSVNLAFRRWTRPTVKTGGRLRTRIGELAISDVREVAEDGITEKEARRAGAPSRSSLLEELNRKSDGSLYRIELHLAGPDPRIALRENSDLSPEDVAALEARLDRFDAMSRQGPWAWNAIETISANPAVRAPDLAASLGFETKWWKGNIRKLKELGLTESLEVGYRLSPRGQAFRSATTRL